ncbi:polysaccharide transporter, PST family [Pelagirhabdus alkalitolerans]|uniref:Polysaccharide transporter, PST family n=1 Tax=Pelagirhabdus alkalitolerans TaxID=1612202 RepID=A0A1G6MK91_9BACI|nr:polysaccharide biosynthesis protein [Pelagirhabdus alkalitolerans]SDC55385.1 polysaccharide transporter, PST family [Pelagirhabdus alkalitolerans]
MKTNRGERHFLKGALLLTYAGLIGKVLSAFYRIPLQNLTGDVGFYVYQQVYPFIGMTSILALYGMPAAISRLVATREEPLSSAVKKRILIQLILFALTLIIMVYSLAPHIATVMQDVQLTQVIQSSVVLFIPFPILAYYRGLSQGENHMTPTALSQLIEQVVRVSLIILSSYIVSQYAYSIYTVGVGATFASAIGALIAAGVLYRLHQKKSLAFDQPAKDPEFSHRQLVSLILGTGFVMAINHMLLLLLQLVDALTLVPQLERYGMVLAEAQVLKGILDRGQPLSQIGIIVASSLTLSVVPSVTQSRLKNDTETFVQAIRSTWKLTLILSSAASLGLITLFSEVNELLFKEDLETFSLQIFTLSIIFISLSISSAAILQGLGFIYRTALFVLIGVVSKVLFNILFIPYFHITGAALATVLASVVILSLNMVEIKRQIPNERLFNIKVKGWMYSLVQMVAILYVFNRVANEILLPLSRIQLLFYVLFIVSLGAFIYVRGIVSKRVLTNAELNSLPLLHRFAKKE